MDTIRYPDEELAKHPDGYDSILFLKWLKFSMRLFCPIAFISLASILPTNWVADVRI
jgi:hypothetical protein